MAGDMKLACSDRFERKEHEEMAPGSEHRDTAPGHYGGPSCALIEQ